MERKEERKKGQLLHPNITTCTEKKNLLFEILPTLNDEIIQRFIDSFHTFCISYTFFFFSTFYTLNQAINTSLVANKTDMSVQTVALTANNLALLDRITAHPHSAEYLQSALNSGPLARYGYYGEAPVGVLLLEPVEGKRGKNSTPVALKVALLCVLPAYRSTFGVEKTLLEYALETAKARHLSTIVFPVVKNNMNEIAEILADLKFSQCATCAGVNVTAHENEILFVRELE